jgi:catechol 2,3-dioxygenase-like lactoylglutathione lyase family enzyme
VPDKFTDIAAVVATRNYTAARSWYSRIIGREPDLEPIDRVAEWQIAATAWLQLVEDPERAGKSAVRFGVDDLGAQVVGLNEAGISTREPVVVADMVKVVDFADPDGNELSFVEALSAD